MEFSRRKIGLSLAALIVVALASVSINVLFKTEAPPAPKREAPEAPPDPDAEAHHTNGSQSPITSGGGGIVVHLPPPTPKPHLPIHKHPAKAPEVTKEDCERLVEGRLLFEPSRTMRQGQPYTVFARLVRTPEVNIAQGLVSSDFVIVTEKVSCKVSVSLDTQEPDAFGVEKLPDGRKDEQILEPNSFSQWDWRVTPRKHGDLHLLLYVTPMLYVDGIGEQLKEFQQPPRVITVTPDYLYESKAYVKDNWAVLSGLLTAIVIPLFLWFRQGIVAWFNARFQKKASSQS